MTTPLPLPSAVVDDPADPSPTTVAARLSSVSGWHRPLVGFAVAAAGWGVVCVIGLAVDHRTLLGAPIWAKPLKFSLSLAVYALTLAWMLSLVRSARLRRAGWWAGTLGVAASVVELAVISIQVVRGTGSHFNVASPLDSTLYSLMGAGVVVMYSATLVIGAALVLFTRLPDWSVMWSLRIGLLIALAGLSVGFLMVVPTDQQLALADPVVLGSHSVGGDDPSGGLFLLGWNTLHGDLRVAHFLGMHALQGLPLLALVLAARTRVPLTEATRLRIVLVAGWAWASVTALTLWQALRGQSVVHPDTLTLSVAGALLATVVIGAGAVARHAHDHPQPLGATP